MCANDVVVQGAEPLFFLDYYATGHLNVDIAATVIDGIARAACRRARPWLAARPPRCPACIRARTTILPVFVSAWSRRRRSSTAAGWPRGDAVIGLASSGPHSNGYSLIRRLIAVAGATAATQLDGSPLFDLLLTPTRIYVKSLLGLIAVLPVHALAHITGGGLSDNIPRVLHAGLEVVLQRRSWPQQPVFEWLARAGAIEPAEMHRTFNCGIGWW